MVIPELLIFQSKFSSWSPQQLPSLSHTHTHTPLCLPQMNQDSSTLSQYRRCYFSGTAWMDWRWISVLITSLLCSWNVVSPDSYGTSRGHPRPELNLIHRGFCQNTQLNPTQLYIYTNIKLFLYFKWLQWALLPAKLLLSKYQTRRAIPRLRLHWNPRFPSSQVKQT